MCGRDDNQNKCIGVLPFEKEVKSVKLQPNRSARESANDVWDVDGFCWFCWICCARRIVVVLERETYVYNLADLKLIDRIDTTQNLKGLCAISETGLLVCPAIHKGDVRVKTYDDKNNVEKTMLIVVCCRIYIYNSLFLIIVM